MLERTTLDAGGVSYMDIRFGEGHSIHEGLLDATLLAASRDADGNLPPGLPVLATGGPVSGAAQSAYGLIAPEPAKLGTINRFGNMLYSGGLNRKAIEANLGRVLSANELSAIATGLPGVVLK
ncbi:MAG: hypothetical protein ABIQ32_01140 [Sphingomicrobium sp.]